MFILFFAAVPVSSSEILQETNDFHEEIFWHYTQDLKVSKGPHPKQNQFSLTGQNHQIEINYIVANIAIPVVKRLYILHSALKLFD